MGSVIVSVSIPEEMRPLWERLGAAHQGPSKFVQWVLSTLGPSAGEDLDVQLKALRAASAKAKLRHLEASIAEQRREMQALLQVVSQDDAAPTPTLGLSPEDWWRREAEKRGEAFLFEASEGQLRGLAARVGADPEACRIFVARKREEQRALLEAKFMAPFVASN